MFNRKLNADTSNRHVSTPTVILIDASGVAHQDSTDSYHTAIEQLRV